MPKKLQFFYLHSLFTGRHSKHEGDMQMPRSEWVLLINHMLAAIGTFPQNWRSFRGEIWSFDARQDHSSREAEGAEEGQERPHCQRLGVSWTISQLLSRQWHHWISRYAILYFKFFKNSVEQLSKSARKLPAFLQLFGAQNRLTCLLVNVFLKMAFFQRSL